MAERFGTTERHVLQRMRLGRVAPKLLAAYRAGDVTLDALMAFAVTDDHKKQVAVWKALEGWQQNNARHIRARLTDTMTSADEGTARFVGLDAYQAAGGRVKADLFNDVVYLEDPELLDRLAGEKLDAEVQRLRAEGWGWVEVESDESTPSYRCGRIKAKPVDAPKELLDRLTGAKDEFERVEKEIDATEDDEALDSLYDQQNEAQDKIDEIEAEAERYARFDPEEMKAAGCLVSIDNDGELDVVRGLVKPQDRRAVPSGDTDDDAEPKKGKPEFSQSLIADLKAYRTQVAQVELASHPEIAFDLLVFHAACGVFGHIAPFDGLDVSFRQTFPRPSVEAKNAAAERLAALKEELPLAWLDLDGEDERFKTFRTLSDPDKNRILAYCTAMTLKPELASEREFPSAYEAALSLTGASVAEYWRPTKDNYLSRVTKDQLLAIGREVMLGGDQWASSRANEKKSSLAATLHDVFARSHLPDTIDKVKNWLPKGMAFRAAVQGPEPAPNKGRKAKHAA